MRSWPDSAFLRSVLARRLFHAIDYKHLDRRLFRFHFQPELLLHRTRDYASGFDWRAVARVSHHLLGDERVNVQRVVIASREPGFSRIGVLISFETNSINCAIVAPCPVSLNLPVWKLGEPSASTGLSLCPPFATVRTVAGISLVCRCDSSLKRSTSSLRSMTRMSASFAGLSDFAKMSNRNSFSQGGPET